MGDTDTIRDAGELLAHYRQENTALRGLLLELAIALETGAPAEARARLAADARRLLASGAR